jgi:hypothetical protein
MGYENPIRNCNVSYLLFTKYKLSKNYTLHKVGVKVNDTEIEQHNSRCQNQIRLILSTSAPLH